MKLRLALYRPCSSWMKFYIYIVHCCYWRIYGCLPNAIFKLTISRYCLKCYTRHSLSIQMIISSICLLIPENNLQKYLILICGNYLISNCGVFFNFRFTVFILSNLKTCSILNILQCSEVTFLDITIYFLQTEPISKFSV